MEPTTHHQRDFGLNSDGIARILGQELPDSAFDAPFDRNLYLACDKPAEQIAARVISTGEMTVRGTFSTVDLSDHQCGVELNVSLPTGEMLGSIFLVISPSELLLNDEIPRVHMTVTSSD